LVELTRIERATSLMPFSLAGSAESAPTI
jgi:hypothetical protein